MRRSGGMGLAVLALVCLLAHTPPAAADHDENDPMNAFTDCAHSWAMGTNLPAAALGAVEQEGCSNWPSFQSSVDAAPDATLPGDLVEACAAQAPGPFGEEQAQEYIFLYFVAQPISQYNALCFNTWEQEPTAFLSAGLWDDPCENAMLRMWEVMGACYDSEGFCHPKNVMSPAIGDPCAPLRRSLLCPAPSRACARCNLRRVRRLIALVLCCCTCRRCVDQRS